MFRNFRGPRPPRGRQRPFRRRGGFRPPKPASSEVTLAVKEAEKPTGPYTGYTDDDFDDIYLRASNKGPSRSQMHHEDERRQCSNFEETVHLVEPNIAQHTPLWEIGHKHSAPRIQQSQTRGDEHIVYNACDGKAPLSSPRNMPLRQAREDEHNIYSSVKEQSPLLWSSYAKVKEKEQGLIVNADHSEKMNENHYNKPLDTHHYLTDVEYCQSQKPILTSNFSCLYLPRHTGAIKHDTRNPKNQGSLAIIVTNLPPVVNQELMSEIFSRFGEINSIKFETKIIDEKLSKVCEIRFKEKGSAANALMFDKHYIFVGREGTLMLPLMVSQVHVNLIDSLPEDYLMFSQHAISETMSALVNQHHFVDAARTLQRWILHSECNPSNFNTFFALISTANSFIEQLVASGEDLKDLVECHRKEQNAFSDSLKEKCIAMESLFSSCREKALLDMFTQDQREAILSFIMNVLQEVDKLHLMNSSLHQYADTDSKEIQAKMLKENEDSRSARRIEEMKVQKLTEENLELKSQMVSMEIEREKLIWVIGQLEKQLENQPKYDMDNDKLKDKDRQIEALNMQIQGLKQFMLFGGKVESTDSKDIPSRRERRDGREHSRNTEVKGSNNAADTRRHSSGHRDRKSREKSKDGTGTSRRRSEEKIKRSQDNVKTVYHGQEEPEEASFKVVDEIVEKSEGVGEIVEKSEEVSEKLHENITIESDSRVDAIEADNITPGPSGLVEYTDDHTSATVVTEEKSFVELITEGKCLDTTENKIGDGKRKKIGQDVTVLPVTKTDTTPISKVSESILKRIRLGNWDSLSNDRKSDQNKSLEQ